MRLELESEEALVAAAAEASAAWRDAAIDRLVVGLSGDLGTGKTTWVRGMLTGLGHRGRVPSPTFTLLEHYEIGGLTVVHTDFYRLADPGELEFIGLRDWLAVSPVWLLAEWPERGGAFVEALDLALTFDIDAGDDIEPADDTEPAADNGAAEPGSNGDPRVGGNDLLSVPLEGRSVGLEARSEAGRRAVEAWLGREL